jgi:hypothetical protein
MDATRRIEALRACSPLRVLANFISAEIGKRLITNVLEDKRFTTVAHHNPS